MYNCHKVFFNGRLHAIVKTRDNAETLIGRECEWFSGDWRIEPAFIEGIGF